MNKVPTLGILILARNEAEQIGACLASVSGADVCLVADTGSTDGTAQIARDCQATVIHLAWEDHFSTARNNALMQLHTDWVLVLDADERCLTSISDIRTLIYTARHEAFTVQIESRIHDEDVYLSVTHHTVRLFRRRAEYEYRGIIHEDIAPSIIEHAGNDSVSASFIRFAHNGLLPSIMQRKDKLIRNARLLRAALLLNQHDPFILYGLGVTACQLQHPDQAIDWFQLALLHAPKDASYRSTLIRDTAKAHFAIGELSAAEQFTMTGIADYPDYPDLHLLLASILEQQGLLVEALASCQTALSAEANQFATETGTSSFLVHTKMGALCCALGRYQESAQHYYTALKQHPRYEPALHGVVEAFCEKGIVEEEIAYFVENLWGSVQLPEAAPLIRVYRQAGFASSLSRICSPQLQHPQALFGIASAWMMTNRHKEAASLLQSLLERHLLPEHERTLLEGLHALSLWQTNIQDPLLRSQPHPSWSSSTQAAWHWLIGQTEHVQAQTEQPNTNVAYSPIVTELDQQEHHAGENDKSNAQLADSNDNSSDHDQSKRVEPPISEALFDTLCTWIRLLEEHAIVHPLTFWARFGTPWDARCMKALFHAGHTNEAANYFLAAMSKQQLDAEGAIMLAELLLEKGHWSEAVDLLEGAQKLTQSDVESQGHSNKHLREQAIRLNSMLSLAYVQLAIRHLTTAIELQPDIPEWKNHLQSLNLAVSRVNQLPWRTKRSTIQRRVQHLVQSTSIGLSHRS
ncbi:tetratricopeptide repeat protein [Paenibacillus sp. 481]|uniref:tetratricopeptide repeat protein n=1 Tax=Paenibacillus sp. 481 TaxID=2835869 RepID=UPI001E3FDD27|nr:tetratricopeptide repeat protein [Paenibacillus sp. 481]UHA75033.1 tetratricopeptide repeat protein [Paenibacillus sp. 481]